MPQVLIVDDASHIRNALKELFEREAIEYQMAVNGQEGLDLLRTNPEIQLLLVDVLMPVMDGITMIEKVRHELQNWAVNIIVMTTEENVELRQRCKPLKITGWMIKPHHEERLLKIVRFCIKK